MALDTYEKEADKLNAEINRLQRRISTAAATITLLVDEVRVALNELANDVEVHVR